MSFTGDPIPSNATAEFAAWRQAVERRLNALETTPRLPYSSSKGGSVRFIDEGDGLVAFSGTLGDGTDEWYSFLLKDTNDSSMFSTRNDVEGIVQPDFQAVFIPASQVVETTTSGSFATLFKLNPRRIYHGVLKIILPFFNGNASGEVRIRNVGSPAVQTDTVAIGNSNTFVQFEWLHGVPVGDDLSFGATPNFVIECRRTAGTDPISLYMPEEASWTSLALVPGANAAGNPVVF